jgi:hypothetical protein
MSSTGNSISHDDFSMSFGTKFMNPRGIKFSQAVQQLSSVWNLYYGWLNLAFFAVSLALLSLSLAMNSNIFMERNWVLKQVSQSCKSVSNMK